MDDTTRGLIEKEIDRLMKEEWTLDIKWIPDIVPVKSLKDIALGYTVGKTARFAREIILLISEREPTVEDEKEIRAILKRRIPEMMEKIVSELSR